MAPAGDPVGTGFVASLSRPGGNITGLTNIAAELSGKLMELIKELRPRVKRVAVLVQTDNPFSKSFLEQFQAGNKASGVTVERFLAAGEADLDAAFAAMAGKQVDAAVLTPQLALIFIATVGACLLMMLSGMRKNLLGWRAQARRCPSCGRLFKGRLCQGCGTRAA